MFVYLVFVLYVCTISTKPSQSPTYSFMSKYLARLLLWMFSKKL